MSSAPAAPPRTRSTRGLRRGSWSALDVVALIVLLGGAVLMVTPFAWMVSVSFQPSTEAYALPPRWIPDSFRMDNYALALNNPIPLAKEFSNSLLIAIATTIGQVATSAIAGYAFARLNFPFRDAIFLFLLASLMVPIPVTIIPLFIGMSQVGLVNNHLSLILPGLTGAFGVFLMREFFLSLPRELLEAARIDGAGPFQTFFRVALPLTRPALSALGVIVFLTSWNSYFAPLVFLKSVETATLPLGLVLLLGPYRTGNPGVVMAATALAILPVLIVFLIAQRWIVESLARTGIKG